MSDVTNSSNLYDLQMLVTCFSMDRLLVSVMPRFFACNSARKTEYQCLLCEWRLGEGLGERLGCLHRITHTHSGTQADSDTHN